MDELLTWLRTQLDVDERLAGEATAGPWEWGIPDPQYWRRTERDPASEDTLGGPNGVVLMTSKAGAVRVIDADHIARWDPARVLAEVAAKRARIDRLAQLSSWRPDFAEHGDADAHGADIADELLRIEVQPYAGRPGWREEWRLT